MKIEDSPLYSRPYEKFEQYGPQALTQPELLAILLRTGTKNCNVVEISEKILCLYNPEPSFLSLYDITYEELLNVKGIGKVKAIQVLTILEIARRISRQRCMAKIKAASPSEVAEVFMEDLRHKKEENFKVIFLDAKSNILGDETISKGSLTASIVHPREVYKKAISKAAYSIIVMHNHPSGDPNPSKEDIGITKRLQEVGNLIGIPLLDHIIIGDGVYISLKEHAYL